MNFPILSGGAAFLILSQDEILLATDTKQITGDKSQRASRLIIAGDLAVAILGIYGAKEPNIDFGLVIRNIKFTGLSFSEKVEKIKDAVAVWLNGITELLILTNDPFLEKNADSLTTILITGFEKDQPMSAILHFPLRNNPDNNVFIDYCLDIDEENLQVKAIGKTAVLELFQKDIDFFHRYFPTPRDLVKGLLLLQAVLTPDEVGTPVETVSVTPKRLMWI